MSSHSTHLVWLTPGFAADEQDTPCIPFLQVFAHALRKQHPTLRLSIVSLQYPNRREKYQWFGCTVYPCGGDNKGGVARWLTWRRAMKQVQALHQEHPIHHLHAWWLTEAWYIAEKMSKKLAVPSLATAVGQDVLPENKYLRLVKHPQSRLIFSSDFQRKRWQKHQPTEPDAIIPLSIEKSAMPAPKDGKRDYDVVGVGWFSTVKAYDHFLDIVAEASQSRPGLRVMLIGGGEHEAALKAQAKALNLEDVVEFTGLLPREQVLPLMQRAKVLLHSSTYESFGLVFAEALYLGLNIVSNPVGAAQNGERWTVVQDGQWSQALLNAIDTWQPGRSEDRFPVSKMVEAYADLYSL